MSLIGVYRFIGALSGLRETRHFFVAAAYSSFLSSHTSQHYRIVPVNYAASKVDARQSET